MYSYGCLKFCLRLVHSGPYSDLSYIPEIQTGFSRTIIINSYSRGYSQNLFFLFHVSESSVVELWLSDFAECIFWLR